MMVIKTILYILLIVILAILLLVLLILIIPFQYKLVFCDKNDEEFSVTLKYIIFKLKAEMLFEPDFCLRIYLFNKTLVDTSVEKKEEEEEEESIEDTDFITNKGLEAETNITKREVKDLFFSAKRLEKKNRDDNNKVKPLTKEEKEVAIKKSNKIIDSFKKLLPRDLIYVLKRIVTEAINVLEKILPNRCIVDIKNSDVDPYRNGLVMSFAGPLYAIMGDNLKIKNQHGSDFEYKVSLFGRPVLITLFGPIIRLLLDKKVRAFIFHKKK